LAFTDLGIEPSQGSIEVNESSYDEPTDILNGPFKEEGTVSILPRANTIGNFLKLAMGAVSSVQYSNSGVYRHDFRLGTTKPSFTITDNRALSGVHTRAIEGCIIKKLTIEAPAREVATAEADVLAAWESLIQYTSAPTMLTLSTQRPLLFVDGSVTLAGAALANVESFRMNVPENSVADDHYEVGSRKLPGVEIEGAKITGEVDLKFKSWAARQAFYATGTPTEPSSKENNPLAMTIALNGPATGKTAQGAPTNYGLTFNTSGAVFVESESPVSKRERLTQRFAFTCKADSTGTYIRLDNDVSSY